MLQLHHLAINQNFLSHHQIQSELLSQQLLLLQAIQAKKFYNEKAQCFQKFVLSQSSHTFFPSYQSQQMGQNSFYSSELARNFFKVGESENQHPYPPQKKDEPLSSGAHDIRTQIEGMIRLILSSVNKGALNEADNKRELYTKSPILLQIYDRLVIKYYSAKKCREDIVRYILRKVFKLLRTDLIKKERVSYKKATSTLCKRYFSSSLKQGKTQAKNDKELLDLIMPFQKNSKNRTMNTNFVLEIFSSEKFCVAYEDFLGGFEELLQLDNKKKLEKLLDVLVKCVLKNDVAGLNAVNRLPWLDVWLENTKEIAYSLIPKDSFFKNKLLKNETF